MRAFLYMVMCGIISGAGAFILYGGGGVDLSALPPGDPFNAYVKGTEVFFRLLGWTLLVGGACRAVWWFR